MDIFQYLKVLQANAFVFYTKAHGHHWNVEGALFKQFHSFFKEIYEDVFDSIDTYAEWSRRLGQLAPFDVTQVYSISNVKYDAMATNPMEMLRDLLDSNNQVLADLVTAFGVASDANEQGLANFIAERIDQHQFWKWQLTASLKTTVN